MAPRQQLESLINRRSAFNAKIVNVNKLIERHEQEPLSWSQVEMTHDRVNQLLLDLELNFDEILDRCDPEEKAEHECVFIQLEEELLDLKSSALTICMGMQVITQVQSTPSVSSLCRSSTHLPKLSLPVFSGQFEEWPAFSDQFQAALAMDPSLADSQRLQFLQSQVKGEASIFIKDFSVSNENYKNAWEKLVNRYNNEREIVFTIVKELFDQPILSSGSASALQQLLDVTDKCLRKLKDANQPVDEWSTLLVFLIKEKLHPECKRQWSMTFRDNKVLSFNHLTKFLQTYLLGLQAADISDDGSHGQFVSQKGNRNQVSTHVANVDVKCIVCQEDAHPIFKCSSFLKMSRNEKSKILKQNHRCFNCFRSGHQPHECWSLKCKLCGEPHNTLLHKDQSNEETDEKTEEKSVLSGHLCQNYIQSSVLLCTAVVNIENSNGEFIPCRALVDQGSQTRLISEDCVKKLELKRRASKLTINGIGFQGSITPHGEVAIKIQSRTEDFILFVDALVLPKVTTLQPSEFVQKKLWSHLDGLELADIHYNEPGRIDILLGAEDLARILKNGLRLGPALAPVAQNTHFGWILSGRVKSSLDSVNQVTVHATTCGIESTLSKFRELENISSDRSTLYTQEERTCGDNFLSTHNHDNQGKFVVRLTFKKESSNPESSRDIAIQRLKQVEHGLARNPHHQLEVG